MPFTVQGHALNSGPLKGGKRSTRNKNMKKNMKVTRNNKKRNTRSRR